MSWLRRSCLKTQVLITSKQPFEDWWCQTLLLWYRQIVGNTTMFAHLCFVWVCIVKLMEAEVGGQGSGSLPAARESCFCFLLFSQLHFLPLTWTGRRRLRGVISEMHSKVCYCCRHTCTHPHALTHDPEQKEMRGRLDDTLRLWNI